jgi:peroxiredoxin
VGTLAPDIALKDLDGAPVQLADLFTRESILIFWSPTCGFCQRMANDIIAWEKTAASDAPQPIIITSGDIEANRKFEFASIVLHDPTTETMRLYGTTGTPSAIAVDANGKILSELRIGQPGVMSLLKNEPMPQAPAAPKAVAIGDPAPEVNLPDLEGNAFNLSTMHGSDVAVVFWNPGCGFCNRMVDDLNNWEKDRPDGAPELILVSTGTPESNAAHGFDSKVLIDQGFKVGRSFGATGTPSAVLIDPDGNVKSRVAVGAPGVFELIGSPKVAQPS